MREKLQLALGRPIFSAIFVDMQLKRLIPNLLTAGNLVGGILAIILVLEGYINWAPYCILISALFDFLDGFVARLLKVQSEIGKQLDSLADMVTFGVAPGIIVYFIMKQSVSNDPDMWWWPYLAFVIPVFALFRLAKFNLDERQSSGFIGLPTPAMTIFFAAIPLMGQDLMKDRNPFAFGFRFKWETMEFLTNHFFLFLLALLMSILMVSELPLFALKFKHFKFKGNEIRYIFLTISIILLATLFVWALPLIILLYIILSVINNLTKTQSKDEIQS